jgi:hypothetical protein
MSIRDTILDAMVTALNGASKPAGLTIHRHRTIPLALDQLPAQVLYVLAEEVETGPARGLDDKRLARRRMQVCVETRVNASGTTPDQAVDPYLTWAVEALCARQQLVASMHDIKELGGTWDAEESDAVRAAAKTVFLVDYITSASDPDAATAG